MQLTKIVIAMNLVLVIVLVLIVMGYLDTVEFSEEEKNGQMEKSAPLISSNDQALQEERNEEEKDVRELMKILGEYAKKNKKSSNQLLSRI